MCFINDCHLGCKPPAQPTSYNTKKFLLL